MQVLVALSAHSVYATYRDLLRSEAETAAGVDERLLAAQSVLHVSSHFILVLVWAEAPKLRACNAHVHEFMERHGHMVTDFRLRAVTRALPWATVVFSFAVAPTMVGVWCMVILKSETRYKHILSHLFQIVFVTNSFCSFVVCCMILHDLASCLAGKLTRELSSGRMTASRLEEFRLAWLSLRHLVGDLGAMPVTGLAMLGYLLVMITLSGYQTVVSYANDYAILFASSLTLLTLCQSSLIILCDGAHGLADVMTSRFYEPLEARSWRGLSNGLLAEIMAAITTYLIVLFQLRLSDEDLPGGKANATDSPLLLASH
ncbi:uncharacterized protein LOC117653439 isoform X2 [Thrips palmi]|uniref:Uncharacterized protein LOC117653439 isoform X2 n=1 Tax=Thrips palmi TaxID=161013 RepID=A0A6P9AA66_THRPL|nr:uncharacterized protein LOC117653439 isoform X2 [Thrips palmi]